MGFAARANPPPVSSRNSAGYVTVSERKRLDLGDFVLIGEKRNAALDELISSVRVSWASEQVAELELVSHDIGGKLVADSKLGQLGSTMNYVGNRWQMAAIDAVYGVDDVEWTFRARSDVARKLRKSLKVGAERKVSPSDWVRKRVRDAGGSAVVQKSSKTGLIAQGNDQTTLDVIGDLAQQLGWSWTESGQKFVFGSRYWAWKNGPLSTYRLTWNMSEETDALTATATLTEDDSIQKAELQITLPYAQGARLRPWNRLRAHGFGRFDGMWLVESVDVTRDHVSPVDVRLIVPRKVAPQPAAGEPSSSSTAGSATPGTSRYTVVTYATKQVGKPYEVPANPPSSWDCSTLVAAAWGKVGVNIDPPTYTMVNQCRRINEDQLLPGDLIFYFKDAHHVAMFIGNGKLVEAASPSSGVRIAGLHDWDSHLSGYYRPNGASST